MAASRPQSRRAEAAAQVRRETLPRPLLRQQTQLVRPPDGVNVDFTVVDMATSSHYDHSGAPLS